MNYVRIYRDTERNWLLKFSELWIDFPLELPISIASKLEYFDPNREIEISCSYFYKIINTTQARHACNIRSFEFPLRLNIFPGIQYILIFLSKYSN